ncbi:uncharacterized protein LOC127808127 isoform X2 [Diospyros lotus]|uniref:uncharacterized protein LOC127808127 isoform X2 n=1 Tax=Diospyros lotus TaxID=55363 RepID=UPI00224FA9CB|nr:uncharacterized protein LOC127808127 isoform X2 [Diospyros lotus]
MEWTKTLFSSLDRKDFHDLWIYLATTESGNDDREMQRQTLLASEFPIVDYSWHCSGRVGRLSIKIPWKKLGWDPIIITIEDVFVCACQRDDQEWSMDAVERREFAGKKAKLAAAELAKLSRRVCDNQAGQSFISYITAKILDGIQVSIRNVHVLYRDMLTETAQTVFGVKLSSLTIMRHNLSGGKGRGGQVNKIVEIQGLEIYCSTFQGTLDLMRVDIVGDPKLWGNAAFEGHKYVYLLAPVDASISLLVSRSGKHESDTPEYSINAELKGLVVSLNEVQLQRILTLWDHLCICQLREKYGRFRPWNNPLSIEKGWQTRWWQYAQQSILSDVRKKLKKTSWKYLGERLNRRRKYVRFYKTKLKCLREEQVIDDAILRELEQMEKETDIEDILNYRSTAETELQEFLLTTNSSLGVIGTSTSVEKSLIDERSFSKPRGWLNWLSRGMLGAGGTDDSSQFSGVISDEVIKDIYEATKFQPVPSPDGTFVGDDIVVFSEIKFHIHEASATLCSTKFGRAIAKLIFEGMVIECKLREESAAILGSVNSGRIINPLSNQDIFLMQKAVSEKDELETERTSASVEVDISSSNQEVKLLVKVMLQPLVVTYDSKFLWNVLEFYNVLETFEFHHERVMLSLNGFEDVRARLLAKAEYILSGRKRVAWDVNFVDVKINIPWTNANSEPYEMVVEMGTLFFVSKRDLILSTSDIDGLSYILRNSTNSVFTDAISMEIQLEDLYDCFEIKVDDFQVKVIIHYHSGAVSLLEKVSATISLASCIVPDKSILKQLKVGIIIQSLHAHFSPSIYGSVLGLLGDLNAHSKFDLAIMPKVNSVFMSSERTTPEPFRYSINAHLESFNMHIDLENDKENGCTLLLNLHKLDIRYALMELKECFVSMKMLKIISYPINGDKDGHMLCSVGNPFPVHEEAISVEHSDRSSNCGSTSTSADGCLLLHYKECLNSDKKFHKFTTCFNDVDLHCYPYAIRSLVEFSDKILQCSTSHAVENSTSISVDDENPTSMQCFEFEKFGFSNSRETETSEWASIPLGSFPFVRICNFDSLSNLDNSLAHNISEWRKNFKPREGKIRSPKLSGRGSKMSYALALKSGLGKDPVALSQFTDVIVDLDLSRIRIHFHDYSCIIGTVSLPTFKSSLSSCSDSLDMLCSTKGLTLYSSWFARNIHDFLWGPSLANLSPILNVRVRKQSGGTMRSQFEISASIQNVSCSLPPDFLAMVIGYFSLPDWCPKGNGQTFTEDVKPVDLENNSAIAYKLEVLDSNLVAPVESDNPRLLKLEIPQFFCSFILDSSSDNVLMDIPPECVVAANKISEKNRCLNMSGRDLSLSLLLDDYEFGCPVVDHGSEHGYITFIAPFSADMWIRIPYGNDSSVTFVGSTCIMARINNCQLIAKDHFIFIGFEALLDVIDQFSFVDRKSEGFRSDVLQFLQFKKSMKENGAFLPKATNVAFTEIRCFVNLLSINFYHSKSDSVPFELLARADMQLFFSASLKNEMPLLMDASFHSLALVSHLNSVILAECISSWPMSSILDIHLSVQHHGQYELRVSLPSLGIWLHLSDWTEIIDLFSSYPRKLARTSSLDVPKNAVQIENRTGTVGKSSPSQHASRYFESENRWQNSILLIVKLESLGITIHIPALLSREAFGIYRDPQVEEERPVSESNVDDEVFDNVIAVTLQSRDSELVFSGRTAKIKSNLEKINGTMGVPKGKGSPSWPLFEFSRVNVEAEINELDLLHTNLEVQCDSLEIWFSYHIFYLCKHMRFRFPETGSGQFTFSGGGLNIKLKKISVLLTDGRWSYKGPLLEILMRNLFLHAHLTENRLEGVIAGDLQVNYNNILKVLWEPFVEPWKFQLSITRIHEKSPLLNSSIMTRVHLASTAQLNLNVTESLVEAIFRATEIIKDAWSVIGLKGLSERQSSLNSQTSENMYTGRYAPYTLLNLTSLPLVFHVCQGPICADDMNISMLKDGTFVNPGSSVPIYIDETPEEQLLRYRPSNSSDRLTDKQFNGLGHHYIVIQFDGTSMPSTPISMDVVGVSYFEVDFSKSSYKIEEDNNGDAQKSNKHVDELDRSDSKCGFVIPVVCDVSVQRYCKLVRLYSTVILFNATSVPIELRFDIPFGVSPKILDPIYPGQEFPLPLHLAEAGRVRWRPLDQNYLWSEAHNISNILSHENRIGHFRSFVCYPSHPSSDPFRCCISVQHIYTPSTGTPEKFSALNTNITVKHSVENSGQLSCHLAKSKKHFIHQVKLSSPLVLRNYLPKEISFTIESGGVTRSALLSKMDTSFFHIDSSHDLGIAFNVHGFKPSTLKFPRSESFSGSAKFSGTKFSFSETITFNPDFCDGPLNIMVEKVMDPFSGAREICIFVPYLLYNCTGFPLIISDSVNEIKGHRCVIPSCYDLGEQNLLLGRKDGLGLLSSVQDLSTTDAPNDASGNSFSKTCIISNRRSMYPCSGKLLGKPTISCPFIISHESSGKHDLEAKTASLNHPIVRLNSMIKSNASHSNLEEIDCGKVEACMYSPDPKSSSTEITVRVSRYLPEYATKNMPNSSWSSPFFLDQPTASTNVLIPQLSTNAAYVISVTSTSVPGPFSGRTRAITFQPRYILSNACSRDLCYKQRGTDSIFHLGIGKHSHLQWIDTTRELLVSIRFNEPGWQWSGCFFPDHLGDTQMKMRNYVSGAVNMIRVEVQNADVSIQDEKIVGSLHGNSGTNLILLSDDETGFMPYRIDNFSKERLRVYQQKCETFETIIQSYTSCPYAWDEPCYPHRLTVEVPGEHILGSYIIDDVKEYPPVYLPSTSEKPQRSMVVSVHAEGAIKVLSIIDSSYHVLNDAKNLRFTQIKEKRKHNQKQETSFDFTENISVAIPFIGVSLINSHPQELLFACARNIMIDLSQSLDQQKLSFQILSLQIDNQLSSTPYPVILSFDCEYRIHMAGQTSSRDDNTKIKSESLTQITSENPSEPVLCLTAAKWRNREASLVSFEYISLRLTDFHLELEQEIILGLFDFFRSISSRPQVDVLSNIGSALHPLTSDLGSIKESPALDGAHKHVQTSHSTSKTEVVENCRTGPLPPSVVPIGAPWQQIYLLARRQKKIYVEMFDLAPIRFSLSFSSTPWMLRNRVLASGESLIHRGLMALADVEGAQIYLKQLTLAHHMASWESIKEIIFRHYTRQLLHETYKVFGSAGVIGNPMGFVRSMGLGIRDFLSVPARSVIQSPAGLITGMAQGTTSLLSNTVYAISNAATQFTRAAHKGIVAFTFDDQAVAGMEKQQKGTSSHGKGVINEFLVGLTGLLQSPIKEAEKHGLVGVLSGVALGVTGLVARPAASILEVTGKTAQSIRNRSKLHHPQRLRVRLPRPLSRELPLRTYSWDEAVGTSILSEADNGKLKDELLIMCKALKQGGKFVIITERLVLIVACSSLVDLGKPEFRGVPADPEWVIEAEIGMDSIIHVDTYGGVVHIVGSSSDQLLRQNQYQLKRGGGGMRGKRWNNPSMPLPLYQTNLEFNCEEEAEELLQVLLSAIEKGKERGWGCINIVHQSNLK